MARFVVLARFRVKPGTRDKFVAIAKVDAAASVANEPGCHRFDVLVSHDEADRVALYEIYEDRAAFDAHLETPHLKAFRDGIADLVAERAIETYDVTENAA